MFISLRRKNINSSNSAHPLPWADSRAVCQPPPSSQLREPPIQVLCTAGCTWRDIQVHIIWSKNGVIANLMKLNLLLLKHRVLGHPRVFGKICCELKLPPCHVAAPHISHLICANNMQLLKCDKFHILIKIYGFSGKFWSAKFFVKYNTFPDWTSQWRVSKVSSSGVP